MAVVSERLRRRIKCDFPDGENASSVIELVGAVSDSERIQAAIVLLGRGDLVRVRDAIDLAEQDWRDVLVGADLADEDWRARLDVVLGSN